MKNLSTEKKLIMIFGIIVTIGLILNDYNKGFYYLSAFCVFEYVIYKI